MANTEFDLSNRVYTIAIVLIVGLVLSGIGQFLSGWQAFTGQYPRTISVQATGEASVKPDVAIVSLGITTEGDLVEDITEENNEKMETIIDAIKALGVEKDDIKTTNYNVYPKYTYTEKDGSVQDGYTVNQNVEVKIRDFDNSNKIIAAATAEGANQVGSLRFEIDDDTDITALAREDAIAKAKEKAKILEKQTGLHLGRVVNFYEYSEPIYAYGKGGGGIYMESDAASEAPRSLPSIEAGTQEVTVQVTLEYRVR